MLIHPPPDAVVLAMDVHRDTVSTAVLGPGDVVPAPDKVSADEESVRRLVGHFEQPGRVWACYEAARPDTSWPGPFALRACAARSSPPR